MESEPIEINIGGYGEMSSKERAQALLKALQERREVDEDEGKEEEE